MKIGTYIQLIFLYYYRKLKNESVPFAHVAIDYSHSQQPVSRDFPVQAL